MPDPTTFEARLADAFDRYVAPAPTAVNAAAVARAVAGGRGTTRPVTASRPEWLRGLRLAMMLALLALAAALAILAAGALRRTPPGPLGGGQIFVATGPFHAGYIVKSDGTLTAVTAGTTRGGSCPILVDGGALFATTGYGTLDLRTATSALVRGTLDTHYAGFELWSPDGRRVALVDWDHAVTIATPAADGTATLDRIGIAGIKWAGWSDDSSRLAVAVPGSSGIVVSVVNAADGAVRTLPPFAAPSSSPATPDVLPLVPWSPDGSRVALAVATVGGDAIVVVDLGSGASGAPVTVPEINDARGRPLQGPGAWSPDGARILITTADHRILSVEVATGTRMELAAGDQVGDPHWSPDGTSIAYREALGLVTVGLDGVVHRRIPLSPTDVIAWSPDGQLVALVADAQGAAVSGKAHDAAIWLYDPWDDSPRNLLTRLDGVSVPDSLVQTCLTWQPEATP